METREIKIDDVLTDLGNFADMAYLEFEPTPLLPTYSFIKNDEEIRYSLLKSPIMREQDKKWPYYLERIY